MDFSAFLIGTHHTREAHEVTDRFGGLGEEVLPVRLDQTQAVILGQNQMLGYFGVSVLKEDHVLRTVIRHGRPYHHIDGEVGVRQVTFRLGGG